MSADYIGNEQDVVKPLFPAGTFSCMDALYYDKANGYVNRASALADTGTELGDQQAFAALFAGFSAEDRPATAAAGKGLVVEECDRHCTVPSATYHHGQLIGLARDAGNAVLFNQSFKVVTDPTAAIGYITGEYPTATTLVRCRFRRKPLGGIYAS